MAHLRTAFFAGIGAILLIALLPNTSWIFQNDLDLVVSRFPPDSLMLRRGNLYTPGTAFARNLEDAGPESEFALATMEANGVLNPGKGRPIPVRLVNYCDSHPQDPAGWATLIRLLSNRLPMHTDAEGSNKSPERYKKEWQEAKVVFLRACDAGAKAEPDNAYFPMMRATLLPILGDVNRARESLAKASKCSRYEDYTWQEPSEIVKLMHQVHGTRGAAPEIAVYSSVLFPHVTRISMRLPALINSPVTQRHVIKCMDLMARGSDSLITMAVARATYIRAVFHSASEARPLKGQTLSQIEAKIATLDPETAAVAAPLARPFDLLHKSYANLPPSQSALDDLNTNAFIAADRPMFAFALLLVLLPGAGLLLASAALKRRISPLLKLSSPTRSVLAATMASIGVAGLALLAAQLHLGGNGPWGLGEIGGLAFLSALLFMPASSLRFMMIAAPISVLAAGVYLTQTATELRSDQILRAMARSMKTEAIDARRAMGLPAKPQAPRLQPGA